ncbi:hypothetical protein OsI_01434 [Oryza sativa Indica Group]|uniref:DUF7733 domain-containing protein n=1 Tax=Oryza sativa subsp. indica TaxID=39946 RepID=B8ACL8_ORYSI|nr:hypothetical protein OsI_01434 [Oryza sativa Indica Group]
MAELKDGAATVPCYGRFLLKVQDTLGFLVGTALPTLYILDGLRLGDTAGVAAVSPHAFLLAAQIFTEGLAAAWPGRFSLPVQSPFRAAAGWVVDPPTRFAPSSSISATIALRLARSGSYRRARGCGRGEDVVAVAAPSPTPPNHCSARSLPKPSRAATSPTAGSRERGWGGHRRQAKVALMSKCERELVVGEEYDRWVQGVF